MWMIFRNYSIIWAHLPLVLVQNAQLVYIPFGVRYMAHCIHSVYGHSGKCFSFFARCVYVDGDREVKFVFFLYALFFCAMYAFHIYPTTLSYQVAVG